MKNCVSVTVVLVILSPFAVVGAVFAVLSWVASCGSVGVKFWRGVFSDAIARPNFHSILWGAAFIELFTLALSFVCFRLQHAEGVTGVLDTEFTWTNLANNSVVFGVGDPGAWRTEVVSSQGVRIGSICPSSGDVVVSFRGNVQASTQTQFDTLKLFNVLDNTGNRVLKLRPPDQFVTLDNRVVVTMIDSGMAFCAVTLEECVDIIEVLRNETVVVVRAIDPTLADAVISPALTLAIVGRTGLVGQDGCNKLFIVSVVMCFALILSVALASSFYVRRKHVRLLNTFRDLD